MNKGCFHFLTTIYLCILYDSNLESRSVKRKDLLETMERELPQGTIRYSSKVVSIEEIGKLKLVHLADGSVVKTKVGFYNIQTFIIFLVPK